MDEDEDCGATRFVCSNEFKLSEVVWGAEGVVVAALLLPVVGVTAGGDSVEVASSGGGLLGGGVGSCW